MPGHRTRRSTGRTVAPLCALIALITAVSPALASAAPSIPAGEWPLDGAHFNAVQIWPLSRGAGVTVAVVDSGVDAAHPDLAGQVIAGTSLLGDGGDGRSDTSSDSHGTAIAGLIAGTGRSDHGKGIIGLAPAATIMPIRVTAGAQVTAPILAQGITWAAEHGAKVINVSMTTSDPDPLLRQAVAYALRQDAVVIAAAGNNGTSGNAVMYPAGFPGVVSVSGSDQNGRFWATSESGPDVTVAAPAQGIDSINDQGQYVQADGTSYATAYVSATAALIRARYPHLTAAQVIRRIISTTQPHATKPSPELGYGEINPMTALTAPLDSMSTANPLLTLPTTSKPATTIPALLAIAVGGLLVLATGTIFILRRKRRSHAAISAPKTGAVRQVPRPAGSSSKAKSKTAQRPKARS